MPKLFIHFLCGRREDNICVPLYWGWGVRERGKLSPSGTDGYPISTIAPYDDASLMSSFGIWVQ